MAGCVISRKIAIAFVRISRIDSSGTALCVCLCVCVCVNVCVCVCMCVCVCGDGL